MIRKMSRDDILIETKRGVSKRWKIVQFDLFGASKVVLEHKVSKNDFEYKTINTRTLFNSKCWEHKDPEKRK